MGVNDLVRRLDLAPHPEGGWFRETWRAATTVSTSRGERAAGTSILYLLGDGTVSRLHRLAWDEVWHLHAGGPLHLHLLTDGAVRTETLGDGADPRFQAVVPAGTWFGAEAAGWALAGCTMAPGFDPADFELGERDALLASHPAAAAIIGRLTPPA